MKSKSKRYFIPIDGKLYESSEEIYKVYYKMARRERYLDEMSLKKNLSLEALQNKAYPVEERLFELETTVEDEVIDTMMVNKLLKKLSVLTEYELWLIQEIYSHGKSERQIERESEIPRKTLCYQRNKILMKLRRALET